MGKQVTVTKVPAGVGLLNSSLYTIGHVVVLSDTQYAELPDWYINGGYLTSISTVSDPAIPPVAVSGISNIDCGAAS